MRLNIIKNSKYSNGFTLAEVLITLVIIGVIAAMTIPTLMKNTQNQELVTGLKKANTVLSQALMNMSTNNDAAVGDYSFLNSVNFIDEFAKVTNVIKKCNNLEDCFGSVITNTRNFKGLNNTWYAMSVGHSAITADGQIYTYYGINPSSEVYGISDDDRLNSYGRIIVDVNGEKGPNVFGRDIFIFYVTNGKGIIPAGLANHSFCSKNYPGRDCAAKVLKENAINY